MYGEQFFFTDLALPRDKFSEIHLPLCIELCSMCIQHTFRTCEISKCQSTLRLRFDPGQVYQPDASGVLKFR